ALWSLAASPDQTVPYLAERLRPSAADVKALAKVPQFLHDLDDGAFAVREKAKTELARLGAAAEPALREALAQSPSAEVRKRLEELLAAVAAQREYPSGEVLRGLRAVEVLEQIGTREARQVLKTLAAGASEPSLTREAHVALDRLKRADRRAIGQAAP